MTETKAAEPDPSPGGPPGARLFVGVAIFVAGFLSPLLVPLVASSDLDAAWKATLSGALLVGVPEVGMLIAVAVLGKPGFEYLKGRLSRVFRRLAPPRIVSRRRYHLGLAMLIVPLFLGWAQPYAEEVIPGYPGQRWWLALASDVVFVAGLFVLGGEFWDKLRALFVHQAEVRLPEAGGEARGHD